MSDRQFGPDDWVVVSKQKALPFHHVWKLDDGDGRLRAYCGMSAPYTAVRLVRPADRRPRMEEACTFCLSS